MPPFTIIFGKSLCEPIFSDLRKGSHVTRRGYVPLMCISGDSKKVNTIADTVFAASDVFYFANVTISGIISFLHSPNFLTGT